MNRDEINKKILARAHKVRSPEDFLGPSDKYRDEHYEIYKQKSQQFLETANAYKKNNEQALFKSKTKLTQCSDDSLQYPFETEEVSLPKQVYSSNRYTIYTG